MTTSYGNLGDQAITFAECRFFLKYMPQNKILLVNSELLSNHCGLVLKFFARHIGKIIVTGQALPRPCFL